MDDKYLVSVKGTQTVDGEKETLELTTSAAYMEKNGKKFIKYREYNPEDTEQYIVNIIKIENNKKITLTKNDQDKCTQLILECGQRHQCFYSTPIGSMSIGIYTESMSHNLDENGGRIEINYTIDFNADFQSENHMEIVLTKKEL